MPLSNTGAADNIVCAYRAMSYVDEVVMPSANILFAYAYTDSAVIHYVCDSQK